MAVWRPWLAAPIHSVSGARLCLLLFGAFQVYCRVVAQPLARLCVGCMFVSLDGFLFAPPLHPCHAESQRNRRRAKALAELAALEKDK